MQPSKQIRINRILGPDHRSAIIALDHGIAGMYPLGRLADPVKLVPEVIAGGADALIVTPGMIKACAPVLRHIGLILRIDGGPSALTGQWSEMEVMLQVEQALSIGADAVIMMGIAGGEGEGHSLAGLGKVAARCNDLGMPLVAEMLPGGFSAKEVTIDQIATAARLGADLGADFVKIRYQGPCEEYQKVIENCYCPVFVLGGSKQAPDRLLAEIRQALDAGAVGVAIGRNVWQHPEPAAMTRMIREVVHSS